MFVRLRIVLVALSISILPGFALAQGTEVAFGGLKHDATLPVEVSADKLEVDQADGTAMFSGNVVIGQGDMRLSASQVKVEYAAGEGETTGRISQMWASGGVVLVNGAEAAEARDAVYSIDSGTVVMTGDVILTQGQNALSSQRMVINLNDGTAIMDGRVKTILQPGNN